MNAIEQTEPLTNEAQINSLENQLYEVKQERNLVIDKAAKIWGLNYPDFAQHLKDKIKECDILRRKYQDEKAKNECLQKIINHYETLDTIKEIITLKQTIEQNRATRNELIKVAQQIQ